ncbi:hypothetical protein B0J17DRAFT_640197 [Rhizoctonia solani]|nr:hypothetical protein B0J17DRAFT_640197 [Rhizoctonia solani]
MEKTFSGLGTRNFTQIVAPLSPHVETQAESVWAASIDRPQAGSNIRLMGTSIDSPSRIPSCTVSQDVGSYHFSRQHQVAQQPSSTPHSYQDQLSSVCHHTRTVMSAGREHSSDSTFNLARPNNQLDRAPQAPLIESPESDDDSDDSEDPENIQSIVMGFLSLDRNVESNGLLFSLQTWAAWMARFLFEPLRVIHFARHDILRSYALGDESRQMMDLLAKSTYEVTQSAGINPETNSSSMLKVELIIRRKLTEAGTHVETSRELDRQYALRAMSHMFPFTLVLCKFRSLSSVLSIMQLAAPVFRRACPDSLENFVNLPSLFTAMVVSLQCYGTLDVLLGVLTSRPMFFRYNVEFPPEAPESLFFLEDGPGLRWMYGVPDRLLLTFAQMNALFEDFGSSVGEDIADRLEMEIKWMKPIVGPSTEPTLAIGRMVVQECWFLAALIYLYMGLCGADSTDARVVKVRTEFMKIIASVKPKRNPDSFLILPIVILGLAIDDLNERDTIRRRMLGVSECSRPGTMERDFVRVLDNVWLNRRPVVWSDLRRACWEVLGV